MAVKPQIQKCSMDGISVHADSASVNLNFWVTPDDANLDPNSGGLVVYPREPPSSGAAEGKANDMVSEALPNKHTWYRFL